MIYFDNAATTWPKPPSVLGEARRAVELYGGNPGRSSHALSLRAAEKIDEVRHLVAALFALPYPDHIVFTQNATYALNLAIRTRVRQGMHILISNREHNAVYRPVCRLVQDGVAEFDVFSTDGNVAENILSLLRPETGMLICNHISNVDGATAPIGEIAALCRARGIYCILDLSQSAGHLPLTFTQDTLPDALCAPAHKGLFGIQGCGFAWLRSGAGLSTFLEGGSGSASRMPTMPTELPERMEAGTLPTPAIAALGEGIRFVRSVGLEAIAAHEAALADRLCTRLAKENRIRLYRGEGAGLLSFVCRGISPEALTAALDGRGICVRSGLHCAPLSHAAIGTIEEGTVRVSFSYFNRASEVDRFADVLLSLL
ncbi:MAG: aminotransferase class V-fold PLP-dependent enzyme [Clostridia bacterium]|nr:aminotransferase class V-fold PLP-dependent enzyme [Clostridia bacterium]